MPRKNKRRKSAYRHKLGFDPRKYTAGGGYLPPRTIRRIVYENKPSMDRHKAHVRGLPERRVIREIRSEIRKIDAPKAPGPQAISTPQGTWQRDPDLFPHRMEIWYASLGIHEGSCVQNGNRPVLIFSNDINNEKAPIITVIPMSSNTSRMYLHSHVLVESEQVELIAGRRFFNAGVLFLEQITTIDKTQLLNPVGRISDPGFIQKLDAAVIEHLTIGASATTPAFSQATPSTPSTPSSPSSADDEEHKGES